MLVVLAIASLSARPGAAWGAQDDDPARLGLGETVVHELFGQIGLQEGVVVGTDGSVDRPRAPLGVKPLVGFSFHEIASSRVLLGLTLAVPFSVETTWGRKLVQVGVAPGVVVSRRECAGLGWFAGLEVPFVVTPERTRGARTEVLAGLTLRGGAAWYFCAGLGLFAEVDFDVYVGTSTAFVVGGTAGVVVSYEMFRYRTAGGRT